MMIQQTRRALLLVAFLLFPLTGFSPTAANGQGDSAAPRTIREYRGKTMGTLYMVKVAGAETLDDQTLRFAIDAELRRVNDQMSTYLKSSEISRFNRSTSTEWFDVSVEFAQVVAEAQSIAKMTDGAFDITVAPLVNAWNFGPTERSSAVPDPDTIKMLMETIGYKKLEVRTDPPSLRKLIPELQIDLSSIAKGHGVDRVVDKLAELGAGDVFVEIGGEVRTTGDKPGGAWKVGIQLPDAAKDTVMIAHPMLQNESAGNAMATSGDYRNVYVVDGKRYSHTIDPRTGSPVEHDLASVTVIAKTCMQADGWATALNVLGPEPALAIATQNDLHALLVSRSGAKEYQMVGSGVLAQYAQATPDAAETTSWLAALVPIAILTFGVFSILLFAMAIGVVFGRRSISGSCGGLANKTNEDGSTSCSLCSNPSDACKELREKMESSQPDSKQSAT
ncbi:Thiamine biosynthesis lipoprotein ApbE precursor [Stieleria neptunia]|uniref:FAD:protein FMN transferase n=1 Tax=Stieleria neptunia TaxID=2527979 RepID=A0A518HUB0_9BACT|nr:FAD:protein FMN transferase [Stieleria neptunia]QDV44416.1 Thiamine biosynthesis lipoprotein ApbE precursor [Stieleria neptunia]